MKGNMGNDTLGALPDAAAERHQGDDSVAVVEVYGHCSHPFKLSSGF